MDLSIIIVNWNTRDLLGQCLSSVYDTVHGLEFEVLVVDNASCDGSAAMVRERFPEVRLVCNEENVGFACANNQAICACQGRYVLLLNSDVLVLQGALNQMVDFISERSEIGALGCQLLNEDGSIQHYPKRQITLAREFGRAFYMDELAARLGAGKRQDKAAREVGRIKGACMLLRREAIDSVGLMEENFFMFAEEDDWCLRILREGWKIYFLPQVAVVHYGGSSVKQVSEEMFLHLHRSKIAFFRKHYGATAALALKGIYAVGYAVRAIGAAFAALVRSSFRQNLRNYRRLMVELPTL